MISTKRCDYCNRVPGCDAMPSISYHHRMMILKRRTRISPGGLDDSIPKRLLITTTKTTKMMSIQKLISAIAPYGCNGCRNGPFLHTSLIHGVCSKYGGRCPSKHKNLEEITSKQFLKNNIVRIKIEECSRLRNNNNNNVISEYKEKNG
jgi:hypothetical protein